MKTFLNKIASWFKNWAKAKSALCIGLALVLVGGFLASLIQTDFFAVDIELKEIVIDISETKDASANAIQKQENSGTLTKNVADIYRPKNASAENPVSHAISFWI